jgi:hypothetical protein
MLSFCNFHLIGIIMGQISSTTLGLASLLAVGALYFVHRLFGPRSQLDLVPGPEKGHFLLGHIRQMWKDETLAEQWTRTYGRVVKIATLFNVRLVPPILTKEELSVHDIETRAHPH